MPDCGELEIGLYPYTREANGYLVSVRYQAPPGPEGSTPVLRTASGVAVFSQEALLEKRADLAQYGQALAQALFAPDDVRELFSDAVRLTKAAGQCLRVRLLIDLRLDELQKLLWETLRSPVDGYQSWLMTDPDIFFSRFLTSSDWTSVRLHRKDMLRALVFIANPIGIERIAPFSQDGLPRRRLAPIAVAEELERAQAAMKGVIEARSLVSDPAQPGRATLNGLMDAIENFKPVGMDVLYIVAHGLYKVFPADQAGAYLLLEDDDGKPAQVPAMLLVRRIAALPAEQRPRLVVLASCQSGGNLDEGGGGGEPAAEDQSMVVMPLGPALSAAGVPAVVAMQGSVTMRSMKDFMPAFFRALSQEGLVDQAMQAARSAIQGRPDDWMPVLFMRLTDGRIWRGGGARGADTGVQGFGKWSELVKMIHNGRERTPDPSRTSCLPVLGPALIEPLVGSRSEAALGLARMHGFPFSDRDRDILPQVAQFISFANSPVFTLDTYQDVLRGQILARYPDLFPRKLSDAPSLYEMFRQVGRESRSKHPGQDMHALLAGLGLPLYLTANPDPVLFDALSERKTAEGKKVKPVEVVCNWREGRTERPRARPTPAAPWVVYLFGHLSDRTSLVLTQDDYYDYLIKLTRSSDFLPKEVSQALIDSSLLFLGFPLDDWSLRLIFRYLSNSPSNWRIGLHSNIAVQLDPEDGRIQDTERARKIFEKLFQTTHVEIFWGPAEAFIEELVNQVNKG